MSQNLLSVAVVIGALRVKTYLVHLLAICCLVCCINHNFIWTNIIQVMKWKIHFENSALKGFNYNHTISRLIINTVFLVGFLKFQKHNLVQFPS